MAGLRYESKFGCGYSVPNRFERICFMMIVHTVRALSAFQPPLSLVDDLGTGEYVGAQGVNYCRLDGSTSAVERQRLIDTFNDPR